MKLSKIKNGYLLIFNWVRLSLGNIFPFLLPKNIVIQNGKIKIELGSKLAVDQDATLYINGNLSIKKSFINIKKSKVSLANSEISHSNLVIYDSNVKIEDHFLLNESTVEIKSSNINISKNCRVQQFSITAALSDISFGSYVLIEKKLYYLPTITIIKSTVTIGDNTSIQSDINCKNSILKIGSNVFINYGTQIRCHERIEIGNYVLISYDCLIFDTNTHSTSADKRIKEIDNGFPNSTLQTEDLQPVTKPIYIHNNSWIGMRSAILKGSEIGENATVGLMAVISGSVLANKVAVGNPYRIVDKES